MEKGMTIVAAVDKNWGIGSKGQLLVKIPEDMEFFRQTTTGHVVIMGRSTWESIGKQGGLQNRINIVLSRNPAYKAKGAIVAGSIEEAVEKAREYRDKEWFVIGGGSVYQQMLPYCTKAYITYIDFAYSADSYMENLDNHPQWKLVKEGEEQTYFDLEYYFRIYYSAKIIPM